LNSENTNVNLSSHHNSKNEILRYHHKAFAKLIFKQILPMTILRQYRWRVPVISFATYQKIVSDVSRSAIDQRSTSCIVYYRLPTTKHQILYRQLFGCRVFRN